MEQKYTDTEILDWYNKNGRKISYVGALRGHRVWMYNFTMYISLRAACEAAMPYKAAVSPLSTEGR